MIKNKKEILLYLLVGGLTTFINLSSFYLFRIILSINLYVSVSASWILSVLFAFFANRIIVFENKNNIFKSLFLFKISRIVSLFIEMLIMYIGTQLFYIQDLYVKAFAMIFILISNFILSKKVIFK